MDHFRSKTLGGFATKPQKLEVVLGSPMCAVRWECSLVQGVRGEGRREKMKTEGRRREE